MIKPAQTLQREAAPVRAVGFYSQGSSARGEDQYSTVEWYVPLLNQSSYPFQPLVSPFKDFALFMYASILILFVSKRASGNYSNIGYIYYKMKLHRQYDNAFYAYS